MSKLFSLREWVTVPEAAKYLSVIFGEEVTEADVLRFALDRHLKLSVNFINRVNAKFAHIVDWESTEWLQMPPFSELNEESKYWELELRDQFFSILQEHVEVMCAIEREKIKLSKVLDIPLILEKLLSSVPEVQKDRVEKWLKKFF